MFTVFGFLVNRPVALVVKVSALRTADPEFNSHVHCGNFSGLSHSIGTPTATVPGAWHYRVIAGTCWPGVNIL